MYIYFYLFKAAHLAIPPHQVCPWVAGVEDNDLTNTNEAPAAIAEDLVEPEEEGGEHSSEDVEAYKYCKKLVFGNHHPQPKHNASITKS